METSRFEITDLNGQIIVLPPAPSKLQSLMQAFGRPVHIAYRPGSKIGEIKSGDEKLGYIEHKLSRANAT